MGLSIIISYYELSAINPDESVSVNGLTAAAVNDAAERHFTGDSHLQTSAVG